MSCRDRIQSHTPTCKPFGLVGDLEWGICGRQNRHVQRAHLPFTWAPRACRISDDTKSSPDGWTPELETVVVLRDIAYTAYKRNLNTVNWGHFHALRNQCVESIRSAKKRYAAKYLDDNLTSTNLWKMLNSVGVINKPTDSFLPSDCCVDEINSHFTEIARSTRSSLEIYGWVRGDGTGQRTVSNECQCRSYYFCPNENKNYE